jgi:HEAT repeat protein
MHRTSAALAALLLVGLLAPALGAQERWPISLYRDALKLEEKKDYPKAIEAFKKVIEKAESPERGAMYAMLALDGIGRCQMAAGSVDEAFATYKDLAGRSWSDPEIAQHEAFLRAQERLKRNRVDMYLDQLAAATAKYRQREWKDASLPKDLLDKKKEIGDKVGAIGKDGVYGLRMGMDTTNPLVREFAAMALAKLADDSVVNDLAGDLKDEKASSARKAGAATALAEVITRAREATRLEDLAAAVESRMDRATKAFKAGPPAKVPADFQAAVDAVFAGQKESETGMRNELKAHRDRAATLRNTLPKPMPVDALVEALGKGLADPDAEARLAACLAAGALGDARLEEAVVKVLGDASAIARAAAASACGQMRSRKAVKALADLLAKDEPAEVDADPEKVPGREVPAVAVRRNAAEALGRIGDVTAVPALIDGLNDNDEAVRSASHAALVALARKTYKVKVKAGDKEVESTFSADLPAEARAEVAKQWQAWYDAGKGVDILLERYRSIAFRWVDYNPIHLYDEEYFLRRAPDRQITADEAKAFIEEFKKATKQVEDDIAALGTAAVPQLLKYLGGEAQDNPESRDPVVRRFVAGAIARSADDETVKQVIALANDAAAPAPRRAGAAIALGLLAKPGNPAEVSSALQGLLNVADSAEVRVAAAGALGRLGLKDATAALVTKIGDTEPDVVIAVLRALASFKAAEAVAPIGQLMKDGGPAIADPSKGGKKEEALEFAVLALGEIGSAEGVPTLIRARAHPRRIVWETAQQSINRIVAADKAALAKILEWVTGEGVLAAQKLPYLRAAACRVLADLPADVRGADATAALISRILDKDPIKEPRDYDLSVRIAAAEGLVKIGDEKAAPALVRCLSDGDGLPRKGDIRLIAAEGLDKIVSADKPPKWEATADIKVEELLKRWRQLVADWEAWVAKKGVAVK